MPPRYAYWTIIAGGLPTAFRATEKDELLPTFSRIKQKHPDAQMKWFARGKLWESPESARQEQEARRDRFAHDHSERRGPGRPRDGRPGRSGGAPWGNRPPGDARGRDWRPGGEHRDPRQKFKDAKKARNVEQRHRKFERRQRFEPKSDVARARPRDSQSPAGDRPRPPQWDKRPHERPRQPQGAKPPYDRNHQPQGEKRQHDRPWQSPEEKRPYDRPRPPHKKWGGDRGQFRDGTRPAGSSRPPKRSWPGQKQPSGSARPLPTGPKPERQERRRFEQKTFGRNQGTGTPKAPSGPTKRADPPREARERGRPAPPRRRGR